MSSYRVCPNCQKNKFKLNTGTPIKMKHFSSNKTVIWRSYGHCVCCNAGGYVTHETTITSLPDETEDMKQFELALTTMK